MVSENKSGFLQAFDFLVSLSMEQGYLLFDDIFPCSDKYNLDIQDIDRLTSKLLDNGIILYEKKPVVTKIDSELRNEEFDDWAHNDYEPIYSKIVDLDSSLEFFVDYVRRIVPPQRNEMKQLQYQMLEKNHFARKRVIEMHLRLALKLALQYSERYENEISEMISLACEGLCKAADSFKPDENGKFSGYVSYWIMQVFMRNMETKRPLVYYPVQPLNEYFKLYKYLDYLKIYKDETIVNDDNIKKISNFLNISENTAKEILFAFIPFENLDEMTEVNCNFLFYNTFDEEICNKLFSKKLNKQVDSLKEKERAVIKFRFGLWNESDFDYKTAVKLVENKLYKDSEHYGYGISLTLEEIGCLYGLTRERIRQIENKGLKNLREKLRSFDESESY